MLNTSPFDRAPKVGLLDLDIFGPSVPKLMGLENAGDPRLSDGMFILLTYDNYTKKADKSEENKLLPLQNHGVKTMSIGYLLRKSLRYIHRSPPAHGRNASSQPRKRLSGRLARYDGDESCPTITF